MLNRMNPEVKALWVAALRSDEYKQTTGRLRRGDAFCCLGVLCNEHAKAHPEIAAQQYSTDTYLTASTFLPGQVCEWAWLKDEDPCVEGKKLSLLNDKGMTFEEIADRIEAEL